MSYEWCRYCIWWPMYLRGVFLHKTRYDEKCLYRQLMPVMPRMSIFISMSAFVTVPGMDTMSIILYMSGMYDLSLTPRIRTMSIPSTVTGNRLIYMKSIMISIPIRALRFDNGHWRLMMYTHHWWWALTTINVHLRLIKYIVVLWWTLETKYGHLRPLLDMKGRMVDVECCGEDWHW